MERTGTSRSCPRKLQDAPARSRRGASSPRFERRQSVFATAGVRFSGRAAETRVARRDAPQLLVRRVRANALEEDTDLGLPPLQVRPQQPRLHVVGELGCGERLAAPAEQERALTAARTEVPHPLGLASRCHKVALAFKGQKVDRHPSRLAARAAAHLEHARAEHAHAEPGEARDDPVEHVAGEPAGAHVAIGHAAHDRTSCPVSSRREKRGASRPGATTWAPC